jgi:hypothetical protein
MKIPSLSLLCLGLILLQPEIAVATPVIDNVGLSNSTFSANLTGSLISQVQKTSGLAYNLSGNILDSAGSISLTGSSPTYFNNSLDGYIGADTDFPFLSNDSTYNTVFDDTVRSFDYLTVNLSSATTITLTGAYQSAYNRPFTAVRISLYSVLDPTPGQVAGLITFADVTSGADLIMGSTANAWRLWGTNFGSPGGVAGVQSIQFGFTRFDPNQGVRVGDVMAIPEPSTWALVGGSLIALGYRKRRRACEAL